MPTIASSALEPPQNKSKTVSFSPFDELRVKKNFSFPIQATRRC